VGDPLRRLSGNPTLPTLERIRELEGESVPAVQLRESMPGFQAQKGIYKPAGSEYALWVRETNAGRYADQLPDYFPDGSWSYRYSPEGRNGATDLTLPSNKGLIRCMEDRVPVGVFRQESDAHGHRVYKVLGLAFVERLEGDHFVLRGEPIDVSSDPWPTATIPPFQPFESSSPNVESVVRTLRERRFGSVIREIYHDKCSLCALGYRLRGRSLGLEAAHVIPVEAKGIVGDVRNGILLCRNHHSLFDNFAWTFDTDLNVLVTEDREFRTSAAANHILDWEGRRLPNLPEAPENFPAPQAIDWRLTEFHGRQ
jgi:putative restriction endonuclease